MTNKKYFYDTDAELWNVADEGYEPIESEVEKTKAEFEEWRGEDEARLAAQEFTAAYIELVKALFAEEKKNVDAMTKRDLMDAMQYFREYEAIDLEDYPLAEKQIKQWTREGKLPKRTK